MDERRVASTEQVRRYNLGLLLRLLHVSGAASRSDLVARTGLNRSTIGALASTLAEVGLVDESVPVSSGGAGRPSILVAPCPTTYVLAVEIGVEWLTAARVGLGGVVLDRRELRQSEQHHDPAATVRRVRSLVDALLRAAPPTEVCLGLGVAVCGLVRASDGSVSLAPNLSWVDVPLARMLTDELRGGLPVLVGNEADLGAMAEHLRGAGAGLSDLVYLCGEVGVGGGIIVGGRPLTGAGGFAGELGHLVVNPEGRPCRCGRRGCWETEIGEDALRRAASLPAGTTVRQVLAAHAAGDPAVVAGVQHVGRWLGVGLTNLVNLLNPQVVLFGGLLRELYPVLQPVVREALTDALPGPRTQVRLEPPGLGADSNLVGAAELVFEVLLQDPLEVLDVAVRRGVPRLGQGLAVQQVAPAPRRRQPAAR